MQLYAQSGQPARKTYGNLGGEPEAQTVDPVRLFTRMGGFSQTALIKASFVYLGEIFGLGVADMIKATNDGAPEPSRFASPELAGQWIADAIWAGELPLVVVEVEGMGVKAQLDPQAAAQHPVASRLVGQEFAEHVALSLAIGAGFLPSLGFRERLIVARGLNHAGVTVELSDGLNRVWAHYGGLPQGEDRESGESIWEALRNLAGDALAMTLPAKPGSLTEAAQVALAVDELKARGRCDA